MVTGVSENHDLGPLWGKSLILRMKLVPLAVEVIQDLHMINHIHYVVPSLVDQIPFSFHHFQCFLE
jgi:hypothetical protein